MSRSRLAEKSAVAPIAADTATKPKRKRAAVRRKPGPATRKRVSAREPSRPHDPVAVQVLFLPTRPRCLCLTYVGPTRQVCAKIRTTTTIKRTIQLPSIINLPYLPLDSTCDRAAAGDEDLTALADPPRPSRDPRAAATAMRARSGVLAESAREAAQSLHRRFFILVDGVNRIDPSAAMMTAVVGIAAAARPAFAQTRSLRDRLRPLGDARRRNKARAAAVRQSARQSLMGLLRYRILRYVPRFEAIDPRAVAMVAVWSALVSGALISAITMRTRMQLLKTESLMSEGMPQGRPQLGMPRPALPANPATENRTNNKKKNSKAAPNKPAQDNALIESWVESGKTVQAKQPQRAAGDVRIIDAPARMKRNCYEQTWPYIAAHCLTIAEESAPAAADPVDATATLPPGPAIASADAATPPQPAPSVQPAAHVAEKDVAEKDVAEKEATENTDRHTGSARRAKTSIRTSGHRVVASASEDDSSPMPEKRRAARTRQSHYAFERYHDGPQNAARSLPVRDSGARSLSLRESGFVSGPPPYLSFNAY
jgi:hypothetical protein